MICVELVLLILGSIVARSSEEPIIRRNTYKGLQGLVPSNKIISAGLNRNVYYHEQTVTIVDFNPKIARLFCEVIEGYEPQQIKDMLKGLAPIMPLEVTFDQITMTMMNCDEFDKSGRNLARKPNNNVNSTQKINEIGTSALNLLSGIFPGTKWCGTGDVANSYHDLGPERDIDRCCRMHDLCPLKIRAMDTRYNLTNTAFYSKSHCKCDNNFYDCLKRLATPKANLLGTLYFNIGSNECVDDSKIGSMKKFRSTGLTY